MWASLSLVATLVVTATANTITYEDIEQRMRDFGIVDQVIPKPPPFLLTIIFGASRAYLGTILPVCATAQDPIVTWPNPNNDILYTLVAFTTLNYGSSTNDTDQVLLYLVFNIPGGNIKRGETVIPHIAPNPPLSAPHQPHIYFLCRQVSHITITAELYNRYASKNYRNFNFNEFVETYGLDLIAGNFFRSRRTLCDPVCCAESFNSCANIGAPAGYKSHDTDCHYEYLT